MTNEALAPPSARCPVMSGCGDSSGGVANSKNSGVKAGLSSLTREIFVSHTNTGVRNACNLANAAPQPKNQPAGKRHPHSDSHRNRTRARQHHCVGFSGLEKLHSAIAATKMVSLQIILTTLSRERGFSQYELRIVMDGCSEISVSRLPTNSMLTTDRQFCRYRASTWSTPKADSR